MAERNRGERLKSAILTPEARPIWLGNNLEAANKDEKYLNKEDRRFKEGRVISCAKTYENKVPRPASAKQKTKR